MGPHELLRSSKPSFPFRQHTVHTNCVDCINIFGDNQPWIFETSYLTSNLAKLDFLVCFGSCLFQIRNKFLLYHYIISCSKSSKMPRNECVKIIIVKNYIMSFDKTSHIFGY